MSCVLGSICFGVRGVKEDESSRIEVLKIGAEVIVGKFLERKGALRHSAALRRLTYYIHFYYRNTRMPHKHTRRKGPDEFKCVQWKIFRMPGLY